MSGKIRRFITRYVSDLALMMAFWSGMIRFSFNSDTLAHMLSADSDVTVKLTAGRYMQALFDQILLKMGHSVTSNVRIGEFAAIILFAGAVYVLQCIFKKWEPDSFLQKFGFCLAIALFAVNVLFAEMLMFTEVAPYFAFAYFTAILGIYFYINKKYVPAGVLWLVGVCTYQYVMIFSAIVFLFYMGMEYKFTWSKKAVLHTFIPVVVCGLFGVLNIISYRVLFLLKIIPYMEKSNAMGSITDNFSKIFGSLSSICVNACGLIPGKGIPMLFGIVTVGFCIYGFVAKDKKSVIFRLLYICAIEAISFVLMYVIPLMEDDFFFPPRMSFIFFLIQGLTAVAAFESLDNDKLKNIVSYAVMLYVAVQLILVGFILEDRFVSNTLDEEYAEMVVSAIEKYEEETGETVTKIAVQNDIDAPPKYRHVQFHYEQINERSIAVVPVCVINAFGGRTFEKVDMDEGIYDAYFADKNWDVIDLSEQLVVVGDTAYLCVY